jgi:hypothetical protein
MRRAVPDPVIPTREIRAPAKASSYQAQRRWQGLDQTYK